MGTQDVMTGRNQINTRRILVQIGFKGETNCRGFAI